MKTSRFYRWIIGCLLASNLFLVFRMLHHEKHHPHPPRLSRLLHAHGAQAKKLDAEMHWHHSRVFQLRKQQLKARKQLIALPANATKQQGQCFATIAAKQRQIDSITLVHFERVSALCTPKQRQQLTHFQLQLLHPRP
ncbi:MAG: hypothetical protein RLZZ301_669 [Bacteroidota bacterium]|jgi:hypothetical protein